MKRLVPTVTLRAREADHVEAEGPDLFGVTATHRRRARPISLPEVTGGKGDDDTHRCSHPGCTRRAYYRNPDACRLHYRQQRRSGTRPVRGVRSRGLHPGWKGDDVGYAALHERLQMLHGVATNWRCVGCTARASEWALQPGAASTKTERRRGLPYSTDPEDYRPMCAACHHELDARQHAALLALAADPATLLPGLADPGLVRSPAAFRAPLVPYPAEGATP